MTTSVRMDPETERLLERLARERGSTKSQVVRDALQLAARKARHPRRADLPYHALRGLIGSVRGGPPDLSERTGQRFRQLLLDRERS